MSVLPDDQMNSIIICLTAKSTWDDLILYRGGPSDVKESRVMDLSCAITPLNSKKLAEIFIKPMDKPSFKRLIVERVVLNINVKPEASVLTGENKRFETYVKSKDLDLWHVITDGDFQPIIQNSGTKLDEFVPFDKQTDELKKSQVKENKIDLLVHQYEQFVIFEDESIDSVFARFNTIITTLKALDEGYSSKNYVRKFLRALHPKWRAKVTMIEESKDLTLLSLDELIDNLKAKKESSDEECSTSGSKDEEYEMAVRDFKKFFKRKDKSQRAFVRGSWSDSGEEDDKKVNNETCLVAKTSSVICLGVGLEPDEWIKDSGCSKHIKGNRKLFSTYKAYNGGNVIFDSHLRGNIIGNGTIFIDSLKIDNVEHVDNLGFNLLSIRKICDNNCRVTFSEHDSEITMDGKVIGRGIRKKGLYVIKLGNKPKDKICLATIDENSTLWHRRLCHANMRLIQSLASKELVRNLPKLKFDQHVCDACKIRKKAHASHKAKNIVSSTKCLELLHMDLFGPSVVRSFGGNRYTLVIVDDYSRKVEESLNVTFNKTPPPSKTSALVDDDLDEEEAIKVIEKKNLENDMVDETLEIDEIVNIKESRNHPLKNARCNLEAVKRIFRYIKGTTHLGLWYRKGTGIETVAYADSDYAGDYVDRKSTSGICTFMGCCLTSWISKKQTALAYPLPKLNT
nr:retrovirus-related Pol polyprotein from transposon TNT 1-94 [Tanacetum cinerariifolium]